MQDPQAWLNVFLCSPYYQHTAFYPVIDVLERVVLQFQPGESTAQKLRKLQGWLVQYGLPLAEMVPLFAALLSLPLEAPYAPFTLSPERQKQRIMEILVHILLTIAVQQPVLFLMEDLHWADPSTLELFDLIMQQAPRGRLCLLLSSQLPPASGVDLSCPYISD